MKDYYKILGVSESDNKATIKKAYRRLAQKYHPDKNPGDQEAENKFKEISEAYSTLYDDKKRAEYNFAKSGGGLGGMPGGMPFSADIGSIFESMFGFGGQNFRTRARQKKPEKKRNPNPVINFQINLKDIESAQDLTKTIKVRKTVKCKPCDGKGGDISKRCKSCNGLGNIYENTKRGNIHFQNVRTCSICTGRGQVISGLCKICEGVGSIQVFDVYDINISSKKREENK